MSTTKSANVRLGFEIGSGEPVDIPIGHMVVTGQTQSAGKTSTLEALILRSGLKAIAFVTKRGEGAFAHTTHRIPPFFREHCLKPGTLVATPNGTTQIDKIQVGDCVLSSDGEPVAVTQTFKTDHADGLIAIKAQGLPVIEATPGHPLLISRRIGREWVDGAYLYRRSAAEWVRADNVQPTDYVLVPRLHDQVDFEIDLVEFRRRGHTGIKVNEHILVDNDVAWLLGLFLADGSSWIGKEKPDGTTPAFTRWFLGPEEFSKVDRAIGVIEKRFEIHAKTKLEKANTRSVITRSPSLSRWFLREFGSGPRTKRIPRFVYHLPGQAVKAFISGWLDGDGCLATQTAKHPEQRFCGTTTSDNIAYGLVLLGAKVGIHIAISRSRAPVNSYANSGPRWNVEIVGDQAVKLGLESRPRQRGHNGIGCDDNFLYVPVRKVEPVAYNGPVYNIETESHDYLVPFVSHNSDWVFVSGLIDATLSEKNKLLRAWLMKVCRGTKTLAEVQANVKKAQKTARGFSESIYTEIDGYLDLVVPEIKALPPAREIKLENGLNLMDLSDYSTAVQALVIRSVVEHIYQHENGVITVIPEAWEILPEGRGSPAKAAIETLVRKGGGLGNFIWVDSQDLAGVWKLAVRAAKVYLIGVQREANEIKRTLSNIPDNVSKPKAKDVATLDLGQFYACWGKEVRRVYVQPSWIDADGAQRIAMGWHSTGDYSKPIPDPESVRTSISPITWSQTLDQMEAESGDDMNDEVLHEILDRQTTILDRLTDQMLVLAKRQAVSVSAGNGNGETYGSGQVYGGSPDIDTLYVAFRERVLKDKAVLIKLAQLQPEIDIETTRTVVQMSDNNLQGWLAALLSEGFFDQGASGQSAYNELKRRGKKIAKPSVYGALDKLAELGAVTKETSGANKVYVKNPDLVINRREK